ncbi:hypothetical protein BPAE_0257g00120 [Botrytis paeoniae]|uniref:Uncharacterized protein n=1 Tax=Botrytis paeoniae TaxID=278948 RepID=A0A4Z1FGZ6_9HELO|nr:hypothetical protein BPAE_0257g00120 [Botrytis paeoniae]
MLSPKTGSLSQLGIFHLLTQPQYQCSGRTCDAWSNGPLAQSRREIGLKDPSSKLAQFTIRSSTPVHFHILFRIEHIMSSIKTSINLRTWRNIRAKDT